MAPHTYHHRPHSKTINMTGYPWIKATMQTRLLIFTYRCSSHAFLPSFSDVRVHAYSRRRTFKPIQRSLKIKGGKKSLEAGYKDKQIHHHACIINVHMPPIDIPVLAVLQIVCPVNLI